MTRAKSSGIPLLALLAVAASQQAPPPPGPAAVNAAPSRFATFEKVRVHYKDFGSGRQAIVFVHGWTCDMTSWREQVPAFAGRTRVLLVDLPGHGKSDAPRREYTMAFFAEAVAAVLRDAGVDRAILVGHSMGTPVVRQFYRLHPASTAALVAVDGALRPYTRDTAAIQKFTSQFRGPDYRKAQLAMLDGMFSASASPQIKDSVVKVSLATPQHVLTGALDAMFDPAIWKDDGIRVPLLAVVDANPAWTPEYEAYVRGLGRDVEYRVVQGGGHFLMLERPEDFNRILSDFLVRRGLLKP